MGELFFYAFLFLIKEVYCVNKSVRIIAFNALFTALIFIATYFIAIPNGFGGFFNLGDAFILLCAVCLNPISALIAGSIGSSIADLALGYASFVPFTIVIKGLLGLVAGLLFKHMQAKNSHSKKDVVLGIIVFLVAELIVPAGYFLANLILYDIKIAYASIPGDILQMAASVVIISLLIYAAKIDSVFKTIYSNKGSDQNDR